MLTKPPRPRAVYKTYWHLRDAERVPSEYELLTSQLLYAAGRGFEVAVPLTEWYRRYQQGSPFSCSDWERFADPRQTTYARYTNLQRDREVFVDGLLQSIEDSGYDEQLSEQWLQTLEAILAPLRYPFHGLQMVAAYIGQLAPCGRICVAALMQAADEVRRIQRLAYRMAQLRQRLPHFGADSKAAWQQQAAWQPLRETIERLLTTYDFGESFAVLNLGLKPPLDELLMVQLPHHARAHGDFLLGEIFASLHKDCLWHRDWSAALCATAVADRPQNRAVLQGWLRRWRPLIERALAALAPLCAAEPEVALQAAWAVHSAYLQTLELAPIDDAAELAPASTRGEVPP